MCVFSYKMNYINFACTHFSTLQKMWHSSALSLFHCKVAVFSLISFHSFKIHSGFPSFSQTMSTCFVDNANDKFRLHFLSMLRSLYGSIKHSFFSIHCNFSWSMTERYFFRFFSLSSSFVFWHVKMLTTQYSKQAQTHKLHGRRVRHSITVLSFSLI